MTVSERTEDLDGAFPPQLPNTAWQHILMSLKRRDHAHLRLTCRSWHIETSSCISTLSVQQHQQKHNHYPFLKACGSVCQLSQFEQQQGSARPEDHPNPLDLLPPLSSLLLHNRDDPPPCCKVQSLLQHVYSNRNDLQHCQALQQGHHHHHHHDQQQQSIGSSFSPATSSTVHGQLSQSLQMLSTVAAKFPGVKDLTISITARDDCHSSSSSSNTDYPNPPPSVLVITTPVATPALFPSLQMLTLTGSSSSNKFMLDNLRGLGSYCSNLRQLQLSNCIIATAFSTVSTLTHLSVRECDLECVSKGLVTDICSLPKLQHLQLEFLDCSVQGGLPLGLGKVSRGETMVEIREMDRPFLLVILSTGLILNFGVHCSCFDDIMF